MLRGGMRRDLSSEVDEHRLDVGRLPVDFLTTFWRHRGSNCVSNRSTSSSGNVSIAKVRGVPVRGLSDRRHGRRLWRRRRGTCGSRRQCDAAAPRHASRFARSGRAFLSLDIGRAVSPSTQRSVLRRFSRAFGSNPSLSTSSGSPVPVACSVACMCRLTLVAEIRFCTICCRPLQPGLRANFRIWTSDCFGPYLPHCLDPFGTGIPDLIRLPSNVASQSRGH